MLGEAYGWENVARIISFGTLAPRAVTRKVMSIFGHPMWVIGNITKLIPEKPGLKWEDVLENETYIKEISKYEREWKCIQRLQGNVSHTSMHAGGVIIQTPLSSVVPVKLIKNNKGDRIKRVCCYDMEVLHSLHHIKFDILGLSTLETLRIALSNIKMVHGIDLDLTKIDYEDPAVIADIREGDVFGVFQLADQPQVATRQKPNNFRDIIAYEAIIRPGNYDDYYNKRNGEEDVEDYTERPWLIETYGEYVYQEQYLLDAMYFADWSIAYADKHIRKNNDIINDKELEDKLYADTKLKHNDKYSDKYLADIWWRIQKAVASGYSFNKSHACCYGKISFQEAFIKHYYPQCFFSALLTKHGDDQEKIGVIINECKSRKIQILPPDINLGSDAFVPTERGISYRLSSIKGIGDTAFKELVKRRPISSLSDLMDRRTKSKLKDNNITALIQSGCFDFEEPDRGELLHQLAMAKRTKTQIKEGLILPKPVYDIARGELESLGIFLTRHILDKYAFRPLKEQQGNDCLVAGIVTGVRIFNDKNGNEMCFCTISNQYESIKLVFFASTWKLGYKDLCVENKVIYAKGKKDGSNLLVNKAELIEEL